MSDQWLWRVEARAQGHRFGWKCLVDRLSRKIAGETAQFYAARYPEWKIRLHDEVTGEVIHVGPDGLPLQEAS